MNLVKQPLDTTEKGPTVVKLLKSRWWNSKSGVNAELVPVVKFSQNGLEHWLEVVEHQLEVGAGTPFRPVPAEFNHWALGTNVSKINIDTWWTDTKISESWSFQTKSDGLTAMLEINKIIYIMLQRQQNQHNYIPNHIIASQYLK